VNTNQNTGWKCFGRFYCKMNLRVCILQELILSLFWGLIDLEDQFYSSCVRFFSNLEYEFYEGVGLGRISWNLV